jgi:CubicO group peptidase (beta-lactamase class C family)
MAVIPVDAPESLGIDGEKLDELRARARREVDEGLLSSCQFALARHGRLAAFETYGDVPAGRRYAIFSATKAFVAAAAWILIGEGRLDVSRRVAELVPEFGTNGKEAITVEQLMLHTSGFPHAPLGPPTWSDRQSRLATFSRWRLNWEPGTAFEYHATSAHWVLAELIERLSGQDYRAYVHERVTAPLGLPQVLGVPAEELDDVVLPQMCGEPPSADEVREILGVAEMPFTEVTPEALIFLATPESGEVGVPGGGGIATAATVALFYQGLLHDPAGIWDPEVLADATGHVRNRLGDPLRGIPANRTLGLIVAGDDGMAALRGFGHTQSPRTFGHNGAGGQLAWADPDSGLSFCYLTNGLDLDVFREARRSIGLTSRAAVCAP